MLEIIYHQAGVLKSSLRASKVAFAYSICLGQQYFNGRLATKFTILAGAPTFTFYIFDLLLTSLVVTFLLIASTKRCLFTEDRVNRGALESCFFSAGSGLTTGGTVGIKVPAPSRVILTGKHI